MASWDVTKSLHASMICTLVLLCLLSAVTQCSIIVSDTETNETYFLERMAESTFGDDLPTDGLSGYLVIAKPLNACSPIQRPPSVNISEGMKWIALISRSDKNSPCTFAEKVLNAQEHNYAAVIVYNRRGEEAVFSMNSDSGQSRLVVIPSVFVGYSDGFHMRQFSWTHSADRYVITVKPSDYPIDLNYYLLPFAIVVGVCFVLMLVFMLAKWIRDYRKRRRSRLSKTNLKKLPVKKFKKGDNYDICAICLDEYENGDKLRILPCAHAYHMKCVDPWLTNNKRTCPVCKRKVLANDNERHSDSDESDDDSGPSETTPLLPPPGDTSQRRSTFENSGLPISTHPVSVNVASSGSTEGPDSPRPHGRHNSAYESDSSDDDAGQAGVSARPGPFEGEQGSQEVQVESDDIVFHSSYFEMKPDNSSPPQSTAEVPSCGVDGVSTSTTHECDDSTATGDVNTTQADVVVQTNRDAPDGTKIV